MAIKPYYEEKKPEIDEIEKHLHILVLRKSAWKLLQYVSLFKRKKLATSAIIDVKYELSKCRPEVLNILIAMANDPERFEFDVTSDRHRKILVDSKNRTRFQIFNFSSSADRVIPSIYVNAEKFLSDDENMVLFKIVESLYSMKKNQYKLQAELKTREEQHNVFQIYQNEKDNLQ